MEIACGYDDIFRIRRFHDQHPSGKKHPVCCRHQFPELIETNMFYDVYRRYNRDTLIRQACENGQCLTLDHVAAMLDAGCEHGCIEVNASCKKAVISRYFQPFAPPAAQIEQRGFWVMSDKGRNER